MSASGLLVVLLALMGTIAPPRQQVAGALEGKVLSAGDGGPVANAIVEARQACANLSDLLVLPRLHLNGLYLKTTFRDRELVARDFLSLDAPLTAVFSLFAIDECSPLSRALMRHGALLAATQSCRRSVKRQGYPERWLSRRDACSKWSSASTK
jgi:hypothetical protein